MAESAKWRKEESAGGVVYKKQNGKISVLLIMPKGKNFGPPVGYWTWPKGLSQAGEEKKDSALREVREESGVEAEIKEDLGYVKFFRGYDKTLKFVYFFLMEYKSGDPKDHDDEVADAEWVGIDEALEKLKFPHDKEVLERAIKSLRGAEGDAAIPS